ncbi:MAG: hypothetical protein U0R64_04185 [Candidatus Nanopelagicales bacterium]
MRPDVAVVQTPVRSFERIYVSHPDHLPRARRLRQAIYPDARNPFAHPTLLQDEGLADWAVPQTWMMGYPEPDYYRDVTDSLPSKVAALSAHESQTAHMDLDTMLREWGPDGAPRGLPDGRVAEAFKVLDTA